ncbi:putative DAHP synthetase, class II, aldolase-type TIM barrel [Plasmopara halstedii]
MCVTPNITWPKMADKWTPSSWRQFPIKQQASYPDEKALKQAHDKLKTLPGLVSVREIEELKKQLAEVAAGKRFLLQGGDCAERFQDCQPDLIEKKLKIMIQMSLVLVWGARIPTVRVARMAGQFAKPRSNDTEMLDGDMVTSFRGENINGYEKNERTPDPRRLLDGYFHSAATLNYGRVLVSSGFADIHDAGKWDLDFVQTSSRREEYQHMVNEITDSLHFVHMCGVGADSPHLKTVDLFVSHEGLELGYEETMTRKVDGKYYNVGTDFLWIGDRTRQLDHAHIEYFRGIENPIGIKVGPSMAVEDLVPLIRKLWKDPDAYPGKITLITRYGYEKVASLLPKHIKVVKDAGLKVIWSCDPCHGNTIVAENGYKTRQFDRIFGELEQTLEIHREAGSILGGVHFELTGENVTECTGGPQGIDEADLPLRYTSYCDPRLNYSQSMEVAFLLAKNLSVHHDLAPLNETSKNRKRSMEISDPSKRFRA